MRILQISSAPADPKIGGTERVVWEISKRLAKNQRVTILQTTLYSNKKRSSEETKQNVRIITCKNNLFIGGLGWSFSFVRRLRNMWKNFDVIHIHGYGRLVCNHALWFLKNKKPIIFTAHGFHHTKRNLLFKRLYDLTIAKTLKYASICTALTQEEIPYYIKLGVDPNKIIVIPNGLDYKIFSRSFDKRKIRKIKQKYGIENKPILLYVGRIHKSKGLQYILEAIKHLDIQFLVIGKDAGYKAKFKMQIDKLKIKNKVKLLGVINDEELPIIYRLADVFILFSEHEGFGIALIEAMAAGRPVIVSNRGALPYIIKNKKNGIVVPYKDISRLKKNLELLFSDSKLRQKLGKLGKKFVKKLDWDTITKMYEKVYIKVIKRLIKHH